jgi:beta-phosphoglucomutase
MIKACIFDMDGVIVDSAKYHFLAWRQLADELEVEFSSDDNEALKGLSRVDSLEWLLDKGGLVLDNRMKEMLMAKKNQWYLDHVRLMTGDEVLPGVRQFIEHLRSEGIRIGLGSSSKNSSLILEKTGLLALFDAIVDGNKVTFSKPDPEVFLKGAAALGVNPDETIVFEDSISGIKAANDGGFKSVGIGDRLVLSEADVTITTFEGMTLTKIIDLLRN